MKRTCVTPVAALLLVGMVALLSEWGFGADEKKKSPADVKFACSQHGPSDMQLTLSLESGNVQKIEFIGTGTTAAKWTVKIDGVEKNIANQSKVKVRSGDSITWSVEGGKHGVAFAEEDLAKAMLEFDEKVGKKLEDLNGTLTSNQWKMFGMKRWGTKPTTDKQVIASCKVK
jgi:plastocyanin